MSHTRNNKTLYNYVVNTFGLSKEVVMKYVDERLEDLIGKHLKNKLDSKWTEKVILDNVTEIVANGVSSPKFGMWWEKKPFEDYLKKVLLNVLEHKLNEEYTLEVKMVRKDKQVIAKF
jgi:hypothetical protein